VQTRDHCDKISLLLLAMKALLSVFLLLVVTDHAAAEMIRGLKKRGKLTGKKAKKSGKRGKRELKTTLVANFGNPLGSGRVSLRFNPDDSMLVHVNVVNSNAVCTTANKCLLKINEGTCDNIGALSTAPGYEGAWSSGENYFTFDANGISRSVFVSNNGFGYDENKGKIVTLSDSSDTVWACSVIMAESMEPNTLYAEIGVYPNYTGGLTPSGIVKIVFNYDGTFKFMYDLEGLEENCEDCGIHIHDGVSCETHEQVMGHGWNAAFVRDLWKNQYGAVYETDHSGSASSYFYLSNGWSIGINNGHAVVIHGKDGTRIGCGQLM